MSQLLVAWNNLKKAIQDHVFKVAAIALFGALFFLHDLVMTHSYARVSKNFVATFPNVTIDCAWPTEKEGCSCTANVSDKDIAQPFKCLSSKVLPTLNGHKEIAATFKVALPFETVKCFHKYADASRDGSGNGPKLTLDYRVKSIKEIKSGRRNNLTYTVLDFDFLTTETEGLNLYCEAMEAKIVR